MNGKGTKLRMAHTFAILVLIVTMIVAVGCARRGQSGADQSAGSVTESRGEGSESAGEGSESGGEGGGEGSGEHGSGGESGGEGGSEGSEGGAAGSEEGGGALALDETFDMVRAGARLIMSYDAASNAFVGTVENTTNATLTRVRIEVHLSNGIELGPTTPTDLAPGEILDIVLPASTQSFDGWTPHAEVGASEGGGEGSGEGGGESGSGEGSGESGDPSSPILALDESWDGVVNGVRTAMSYDPAARIFSGIVENTTNQTLCFVQIELNLKQGTTTVVELGPQPVGDLAPGAQTSVELRVADEPTAVGVAYDAWEIHPETFACGGPGPVNTEGSGGEGGSEAGGEQHGAEGGSESGGEGGAAGSEEGGNALALDETFDMVRAGARLIMSYDAHSNAFFGTVVNTTNATLTQVRIEVHLTNGIELGPTTPADLAPGAAMNVILHGSAQPFDGWTPHAEVGASEGGSGGGESGGEGSGGEGSGEHGSGGEGSGSEGSGGG